MNFNTTTGIKDKYGNSHKVAIYFYPFKDKNAYHATLIHEGRTLRGKGNTELSAAQQAVSKVKYHSTSPIT